MSDKARRKVKAKKRVISEMRLRGEKVHSTLSHMDIEDQIRAQTDQMRAAVLPKKRLVDSLAATGQKYQKASDSLEQILPGVGKEVASNPTKEGRKAAGELLSALTEQVQAAQNPMGQVLESSNPYPILLGGGDLAKNTSRLARDVYGENLPVPKTGAGKEAVNRLIRLHEAEEGSTARRLARLGENATGGRFATHLDINPMLQDVNIANSMKASPSLGRKGVQELKSYVNEMRSPELFDMLVELNQRGAKVSGSDAQRYRKHVEDLMAGKRINRHARKFLNRIRGQFT